MTLLLLGQMSTMGSIGVANLLPVNKLVDAINRVATPIQYVPIALSKG
jgi:hypothetical protein